MESEEEIYEFETPVGGLTGRLDAWLVEVTHAAGLDFSRSRLQGLIKSGFVTAPGFELEKKSASLPGGVKVILSVPPPVPAEPQPQDLPLNFLYEDEDIIVLNKAAGMVVHPAPGHAEGTLVNALLFHRPQMMTIGGAIRPGIVHRLDQETSGVMVVAKNDKAMKVLAGEFATHANMTKEYLAIVHGALMPLEGRVETLIARNVFDRKKMANVEKDGKRAITNYKVITGACRDDFATPLSLVRCAIETGRTHQIRLHMLSRGCPVIGDKLYGFIRHDKLLEPFPARQMLHAHKLSFKHPITRVPLSFTAPLPSDFTTYLNNEIQLSH